MLSLRSIVAEVLWSLGVSANVSAGSWLRTSDAGHCWRFRDWLIPSSRSSRSRWGHFDPQNSGIEAWAFGHDCFWWGHHASCCMQCSSFSLHDVQHVLVSRHGLSRDQIESGAAYLGSIDNSDIQYEHTVDLCWQFCWLHCFMIRLQHLNEAWHLLAQFCLGAPLLHVFQSASFRTL